MPLKNPALLLDFSKVETAGIEPASEKRDNKTSTSLFGFYMSSKPNQPTGRFGVKLKFLVINS